MSTPGNSLNQQNLFRINLPINSGLKSSSDDYVPPFEFGIKGRGAYDYYWIFVLSCILAFICAAGIGANDVANSFATSVGSKTLKMWQAIIIASICEFLGAYLLGSRVTATIRSGIVSSTAFAGHDDLLMFGMMCAILVVGVFLFVATSLELPVSTTHSIVGSIVGFALCSPGGGNAVQWDQIGLIVASWFVSPILAGIISCVFFVVLRLVVLRSSSALKRMLIFLPILVFVTVTLNVIFILFKGGVTKGQGVSGAKLSDGLAVGIAFAVGGGIAILVALFITPLLRRRINGMTEESLIMFAVNNGNLTLSEKDRLRLLELQAERKQNVIQPVPRPPQEVSPGNSGQIVENGVVIGDAESSPRPVDLEAGSTSTPGTPDVKKIGWFEQRLDKFFNQKYVHDPASANTKVSGIHDRAEVFPLRIEFAFGYLQVFTAIFASFAHGANDVANSIGPLAAVNAIYTEGPGSATNKNSPVPDWILVLGGGGLVVGLALYGHIIISAMGVKMTKITPARGFCAELATALVIVVGSFLALPLSSTHCAVGAIVGIGVAECRKDSVNWKLLGRVFLGWVLTLIIAGSCTAALYSWSTFSPSQIYPLALNNCLAFYGDVRNVSQGDPSSYTQTVNEAGTVVGVWGYPSNGSMFTAL